MKCVITRNYVFEKEEVEELLKHFGSYRKMGKVLGYSGSYIHDVLHNRRKVTSKFVYFLKQYYDLSKFHYYEEEEPVIVLY